ncbi:MAG: conjugative transfer signal peptidase TraF [Planctomycetota bacterium]|jgi:conjugative transfer signal peptidase TraF|nr:conjugative transfer signal peptidase TraF [Planctomycetota bacterium]
MSNSSIVPTTASVEDAPHRDSCAGCRAQQTMIIFLTADAKEKRRDAQITTFTPSGDGFERFLMRVIGGVIAAFLITFCVFYFFDWHINESPSFPRGIYKMNAGYRPVIGDLVFFAPPDAPIFRAAQANGYFKRGNYLLKKLAAASGDVVTISAAGVTVNGAMLPNSKPLKFDGGGRPLKPVTLTDYRLAVGEVLLMSDYSPQSFDARYFGVQNEADITGTARPVWIWD